jgi:hypothetical protein
MGKPFPFPFSFPLSLGPAFPPPATHLARPPFSCGPLAPPPLLGRLAGSRPSRAPRARPTSPILGWPRGARPSCPSARPSPRSPRAARGRLQQSPPPLVGPTCMPQPPLSFYLRRTFLSPPSSTSPTSIRAALDAVRLHRLRPFRGEPRLLFFLPSSPPSSPGSAALSPRDVPDPPPLLARPRRSRPWHGRGAPSCPSPTPSPASRRGAPVAMARGPLRARSRLARRGSRLGRREAPAPACPRAAMAPGVVRAMPRRGPPCARCPRRGRGALARRGPTACSRRAARLGPDAARS